MGKKVLVTGGSGFLGSFVVQKLIRERKVDPGNIRIPRSADLDLRKWANCEKAADGTDIVIHLAANVGGIGYNQEFPGTLFYENSIIGIQMMEAARQAGVGKFVAVGTVCAYPKFTEVPFKEEAIWDGYPEETNAPYGLAKKMLLVQSQAYRKQYGFNAIFVLPANLYGPGDSFDPQRSHVIPALIKKVIEAREMGKEQVEVWGTGSASREFLYVEDAAEGVLLATEEYDNPAPVNLGNGREVTIKELVHSIAELAGYTGKVAWDASKPDGQPRRRLDIEKARSGFGFEARVELRDGLRRTIDWYEKERSRGGR